VIKIILITVDAHHEDYSKLLDVIWLCRKHHAQLRKSKRSNYGK